MFWHPMFKKWHKTPPKVSYVNKKAHPFILAVTLNGDQVTCVARDIFQPKNSKMSSGVKCKYKLLQEVKCKHKKNNNKLNLKKKKSNLLYNL